MLLGNPVAILAASTVGYMVTNVLDLIGGRILRRGTEGIEAPYRAPTAIMALAIPFAAVNFVLLFLGGPSWGWDAVALGWAIVLVSMPVYLYRQWSDSRKGGAPSATERAPVEVAS
jgi:hypothetical protein